MALSDGEKAMIQEAMGVALREAVTLFRKGVPLEVATTWGKPVLRAVLDAYGVFAPADINRMVDSFKMTENEQRADEPG